MEKAMRADIARNMSTLGIEQVVFVDEDGNPAADIAPIEQNEQAFNELASAVSERWPVITRYVETQQGKKQYEVNPETGNFKLKL